MEGRAAAGHQSIHWDGADDGGAKVSSGVYFYKLEVGDSEETKQMILLK